MKTKTNTDRRRTSNNEHRTPNAELTGARAVFRSMFRVRCSLFDVASSLRLACLLALLILHSSFFILHSAASAATNDLTSLLQQGLFEEEANRNLEAAISSYQSLATKFDQDRQVAATAVFRLGECYRKLGRTNDAAAQYERIVREFPDQQTLATLSSQNLAGMGRGARTAVAATAAFPLSASARAQQKELLQREIQLAEQDLADVRRQSEVGRATQADIRLKERDMLQLRQRLTALDVGDARLISEAGPDDTTAKALAAAEAEAASLEAQLNQLQSLDRENLRIAVQQNYANPVLTKLMQDLAEAEQKVVVLKKDYTEEQGAVVNARALVKTINEQIDKQAEGVLLGLKTKADIARATVENLRAQMEKAQSAQAKAADSPATTVVTDEEEQEIRRIQAMIHNSPDLMNAPSGEDKLTPLCRAASKGQLRVAAYLLDNGAAVDRGASWPGTSGRAAIPVTPLFFAVKGGHRAMVELLLARGAEVNAEDYFGGTPLHLASDNQFHAVAETLLANKANVNARNSSKETPLHRAASKPAVTIAELFIQRGADVNAKDNKGATPLSAAVQSGSREIVSLLLAHKADVNLGNNSGGTPLHSAAGRTPVEIVKQLIAAGAEVEARDSSGQTPLCAAAYAGSLEAVSALLDAKADPNAGAYNLPLFCAIRHGNTNLAERLLAAGADPNKSGRVDWYVSKPGVTFHNGGTFKPLELAMAHENDRTAVVKLLLRFKADPNAEEASAGQQEKAPLIFSALPNTEMLRAFLEAGADPNATNTAGQSLLAFAAGRQAADAVEALLAKGAQVNPPPGSFDVPLIAAIPSDPKASTKTMELLLKAKADPNQCSKDFAPLIYAVWPANLNAVKLLLDRGANPNVGSLKDGSTPLHFATDKTDRELALLLFQHKADPNIRNKYGRTPLDTLAERLKPSTGMGMTETDQTSFKEFAGLLRQHGALDDLPRLDRIEVRRSSSGYSAVVFWKGTNDWNQSSQSSQFTILELIAVEYGILATHCDAKMYGYTNPRPWPWELAKDRGSASSLRFPDFTRVAIHRPTADGKARKTVALNVAKILQSGDCSGDVTLSWGDVVEIPEMDHPVSEEWAGLSDEALATLKSCLARKVTISTKDQTLPQNLAPGIAMENGKVKTLFSNGKFLLWAVIEDSRLLRTSSDVTRVKVTRRDPKTGQKLEWVLDCIYNVNARNLWLRDGDVIEVPEK